MSTEVHLLSDYKKDFVRKRFLQTLLAGIRLPSVPWYIKLLQIVIFCLPLLGLVPYFVINEETWLFTLFLALFGLLLASVLQLSGKLAFWRATHVGNTVLQLSSNLLDEENEVQFDGLNAKTWKFLVPPKKHWFNVLLHSLMAGLLFLSCSQYLLHIEDFIGAQVPSKLVLSFATLSILQAFHSLVIVGAPESAVFRAHDNLELNHLSRPCHVILCTIPYWLTFLVTNSVVLQYCSSVSYVIICCLPILWFLGVLPPFEPLVLWSIEQVQVFGFGGTPASTLPRSILQFTLSLLHFGILHIFHGDKDLVVKICGVVGYILSLDLLGLPQILTKKKQGTASLTKVSGKVSAKIVQSRNFVIIKECLTHLFFFAINTVLVVLKTSVMKLHMLQQYDPVRNVTIAISYSRRPNETILTFGWITLACYSTYKLSNELQKAYWFLGLFRSPIYKFCSTNQLTVLICQHIRALLFNFGLSLWLTYYVILLVNSDYFWDPQTDWYFKSLEILALIRIFRWIWQSPESALIELSGLHLYLVLLEDDYNILPYSRPIQLMLIGICRDRLKQLFEKVYLIIALAVSAIEDRPSKSSYSGLLFQVNLIFFPYLIILAIVSSILSTPILAVFTLPIFFISFPRPLRFWPESPSRNEHEKSLGDAVYYEQMVPPLLTALHKALRAGRLGSLLPGHHLLARHEDRTVWIQILEKGNGYVYYQAKGLELQETSCHSLEVTRIDDIFQDTFDHQTKLNHFAFHTLTPLVSLPVHMYASSKNVLTGVIESSDTLNLIAKLYKSTLLWYILKTLLKLSEKAEKPMKSETLQPLPYNETYETLNELKHSSSIEAVNLDSWPSSEPSPDEVTKKAQNSAISRRSAYFLRQSNSEESIPSIGSLDQDVPSKPIRKGGLLPPIQLEPILPGGINITTPEILRRQKSNTLISARQSIISDGSQDDTLAGKLTPPQDWLVAVEEVHRSFLSGGETALMESEWLRYCLKHFITDETVERYEMGNKELAIKVLLRDIILTRKLQQLVDGCTRIVYGASNTSEDFAQSLGPGLVVRAFSGKTQSSLLNSAPVLLKSVAIPAYRSAAKIALDQIVLNGDTNISHQDLQESLIDIDQDWYLGLEDSHGWSQAIRSNVPNLFTITSSELTGQNLNQSRGRQLFRSHLLTLRECSVHVGRLNAEVVRSLWASLNWELLYLTNDDDERYSIQADERLLRNLTVEVADPPLGYAAYASNPTRCGLENF